MILLFSDSTHYSLLQYLSGVGSGEGGEVVLKATPPSTHLVHLNKHVLRNICGKGGQKLIVLSTSTTKYQICFQQLDISPTVRESDDQLKNIDFSFFLLIVYPYLYQVSMYVHGFCTNHSQHPPPPPAES